MREPFQWRLTRPQTSPTASRKRYWSRLLLGLVLLVVSGIFTPAEAQFSNGYSYRREVDFVDAEVIGLPPVLFRLG